MNANTVWLCGRPAAGKTTIARGVAPKFGYDPWLLDGDVVRDGYPIPQRFDRESRLAHLRFAAGLARDVNVGGRNVIAAFVTPYREARNVIRAVLGDRVRFVHVAASLALCQSRDPKGLYARAAAGELFHMTGIDDPWEEPSSDEVALTVPGDDLGAAITLVTELCRLHWSQAT